MIIQSNINYVRYVPHKAQEKCTERILSSPEVESERTKEQTNKWTLPIKYSLINVNKRGEIYKTRIVCWSTTSLAPHFLCTLTFLLLLSRSGKYSGTTDRKTLCLMDFRRPNGEREKQFPEETINRIQGTFVVRRIEDPAFRNNSHLAFSKWNPPSQTANSFVREEEIISSSL